MSISEKLHADTIAFIRKAVACNSREQQKSLRRFIAGLIAEPDLCNKRTLESVLPFLDEALGGAAVKESPLRSAPPLLDGSPDG